jgi:hypothetical protein
MSSYVPADLEEPLDLADTPIPAPTASIGRRVVAGVGGVAALAVAALFTVGGALAAPLGMVIAAAVARRRLRVLSGLGSWLAAVLAAAVFVVSLSTTVIARLPPGTLERIWRSADSAAAAAQSEPPPEWLQRVSPRVAAAAKQPPKRSTAGRAVNLWAAIMGVVIAWALFSALIGTLGWLASLPLAYAVSGQWLLGRRSAARAP